LIAKLAFSGELFHVHRLYTVPRLDLPGGRLANGHPADLVLLDPDASFALDHFALKSKSENTPFDGRQMRGMTIRTFVGGRHARLGDRIPTPEVSVQFCAR